jgi:hypothetical protein
MPASRTAAVMSAPSRTAEKTAAASAKGPGENGRRVREQIQHRQVLSRSPLAPCYVTVAAGALLWGFETGIITDALLSITPAFGLDAQPAALGLEATTATMGSLCGTLTACRENWQVVGAVCGILWLWDVWRCANKDRLC